METILSEVELHKGKEEQAKFAKEYSVRVKCELRTCTVFERTVESKGNEGRQRS